MSLTVLVTVTVIFLCVSWFVFAC